ncbi:MAG: hypothetical protein FWD47_09205 [Treponema sp.]|nr:hypothetical protein [Treponema sp.]
MKKCKAHLLSILIIIVMMVFALSTSAHARNLEITIINNSSQIIIVKIISYLKNEPTTEDFKLVVGEHISLKSDGLKRYSESLHIDSITIYNQDGEIIKEYNSGYKYDDRDENVLERIIKIDREHNRTSYYILEITDELLE